MTAENPFHQTLDFIGYLDQLKSVIRQNGLWDGSRPENTAEHSWHAALSALLLAPYANEPIDVDKVTRMLLIHDLIEIEAGDTFVYDAQGLEMQEAAELKAADIVFGRLPEAQGAALRALWDEFEERSTPEAKFSKAIDRFMPLYSNYCNGGYSWRAHDVTQAQVVNICAKIQDGSSALWALSEEMLAESVQKGWLKP
ncbi:MAG: HD domain-containing protein [Anaerolineaceae bacterium]|nr:HD domain-containing protein [Anaerolineaceae bacterium]